MAHITEHGYKTYIANANIPAGTAVKLSSGKVVAAAAATDVILGTIHSDAKSGSPIDVRLRSCGGTLNIVAGAGISAGAAVTSDSNGLGLTTTTAGNQIIGYALETVSTGGWLELMPSTAKY